MMLPPATFIDNDDDFLRLVDDLAEQSLLAIDTESNNLHAYQDRVCLIQVSTRNADYIIDPLAIDHLQPFGLLLEAPAIEKVFHAAEYDLRCLKRDYGFTINNLFDTMMAARVCGFDAVGLGSLLERYLGIQVDKRHQRDDWGERPLRADSLRYAQMDTHYLPRLRDILYDELASMGRLEEAREVFEEYGDVGDVDDSPFDPQGYWWLGLPASLKRHQMAILRELYYLRDQIARERDLPFFKVMGNRTLVDIARTEPSRFQDLRRIKGLSAAKVRRYGMRLLQAVKEGRDKSLPRRPRHQRPDPVIADRYTALHNWRKARAQQRGVDSDVIISKRTLWKLARQAPTSMDELQDIPGLGPWRRQTYGPDLLNLIDNFNHNGGGNNKG